jgi:predicted O-methyltransferase YrrM
MTKNYEFTVAFNPESTQKNISHIINTFGIPSTIVEIGCYEGYTTCWMGDVLHQYNPHLDIYAIDPHSDSVDIHEDMAAAGVRFQKNISQCSTKNIHYIKKKSEDGLIDLINQNVQPEFVYIDGDHFASAVLMDLVLSFKMLKVGGVILCDDATEWRFKDNNGTYSAQMNPRVAIENFIQCNWHKVKPIWLPDMLQTAFVKLC